MQVCKRQFIFGSVVSVCHAELNGLAGSLKVLNNEMSQEMENGEGQLTVVLI